MAPSATVAPCSGEVGLVFAALGLHQGILDPQRYGALLLTIFLTDLVGPVLLRRRLRRPDQH